VGSGVTILVGARAYPLDEEGARWLVDAIRVRYSEGGAPAREAFAVAKAIEVALEDGDEEEPLELGWRQVEGLSGCLYDGLVYENQALSALYQALRRFRDDPPARSLG